MRAWERQDRESAKAFEAFKIYRDLGSERSLVRACELYYGSRANLAQIRVWSSKFDWVERVRAHDAWLEMIRREAVEQHERNQASDTAARMARIRERYFEGLEQATEQWLEMIAYPVTRVIKEEVDEETGVKTVVIAPAKWSKHTVTEYANMFAQALADEAISEGEESDMDRTIAEWHKRKEERDRRKG